MADFNDVRGIIGSYGALVPEHFGGVFMRDGRHLVLFTQDLQHHAAALGEHLAPEEFTVAQADRSWQEVLRVRDEVSQTLLQERTELGVNGVGIGVEGDQFVISVTMLSADEDLVTKVRQAAAPHPLVVRHVGLIRPAGPRLVASAPPPKHPADAARPRKRPRP